jgi:hypothetical protein
MAPGRVLPVAHVPGTEPAIENPARPTPLRKGIAVARVPVTTPAVTAYVPPQARDRRAGVRQRPLNELCRSQVARREILPFGAVSHDKDLVNKQDAHLFNNILHATQHGPGGPEQFSIAMMNSYVDQCTAFLHVHRFELHLNSNLGLCAFWAQGIAEGRDPLENTSAEFSNNAVVQKTGMTILGSATLDTLSEDDRRAITGIHSAFTALRIALRTAASAVKVNAQLPTQVPVLWTDSLRACTIVDGLQVTASEQTTHAHYAAELTEFYKHTAHVRTLLSTHAHLNLLTLLDGKAELQFSKLTTARQVLVREPASHCEQPQ